MFSFVHQEKDLQQVLKFKAFFNVIVAFLGGKTSWKGKSCLETWDCKHLGCMSDLIPCNKSKHTEPLGECTKTNTHVHNNKLRTNKHTSTLSFSPLLIYKPGFIGTFDSE